MKFQRALITGASSGIGRATAVALAAYGVNLILIARRKERLQALRQELLARFQIDIQVCTGDIRDQKTHQILEALPGFAEIDVLINNAGLAKGVDKVASADLSDWDEMIGTNVTALLHLTRLVLPGMLKAEKGHIVSLGSVAGRWVYPGGAVYCATKFAVRAFSEGLRMDLAGTPLRVTNIEPGMVETEFSEVRLNNVERAKSVYRGMTALTAEDIAETVVWSLSRPAHVNIQELVIFPTDQAAIQQVHRRDEAKPR